MPGRPRRIPDDIAELIEREHGVVAVGVARAAGVDPRRLRRLRDAGLLTVLLPGCFAATTSFDDEWEVFRLGARAFAAHCGPAALLTGWSAVVTWRLPAIGRPPARHTAVRHVADGHSVRNTPFGDLRAVTLAPNHARRTSGVNVVSRAWAVADLARTGPILPALVAADAAAALGADLADALRYMSHWPGVGRARWVAEHADPGAESPLETLGRFTCLQFDLPLPVCNAWVGEGGPEYRVDGLWPFHGVVFEADGALKYDNRPDASRIVARQGEREWRLRRLGLDVVRFGWDLAWRNRAELAARFAGLLREHAGRERPVRWWKHVPGAGAVDPEPADWPSPSPSGIVLPAGWDR
ncbi:type IV toxin-antitoxin system AbiEi family antitoxin domain-containing protein [Jiangella aurantiaca]|uniref:type IV toxin-antitoxin system AbiEi family antitoxin domain-containing protein n=1 Tax=Jiangella aurantiaca TaxID=2530373 RepID=UPI0013A5E4B1|nr:type IV toxin-antitoxin system AbiEi family antitoxin domain-containing protein [Jiangella aurantiaca]